MKKLSFFDKSDFKFVGWNILLAVVLGIGILVALIAYLKRYTEHGIEVEVADVRGLVETEAVPVLAEQGLHLVIVDSTYSDKVPFGTIVDQDPKPDSHAKHGRAVYVTINATTKRQVTMPNLQDISYRQAETTLRGMGLQVDTVYDYEPSAFRDLVLDVKCNGVSVQPGEKLAVGTKVRLVVGFGRGRSRSGLLAGRSVLHGGGGGNGKLCVERHLVFETLDFTFVLTNLRLKWTGNLLWYTLCALFSGKICLKRAKIEAVETEIGENGKTA